MRARVVLVGAGHAHLYTLKRAEAFARRGFELILIAPENFWYSGLATGVLGGHYPPALDQVDVGALARRGGGRFIPDRVAAIEPARRIVRLASGREIAYQALSLNLGSEVPLDAIAGAEARGLAVKPVQNLWRLRQELLARAAATAGPLRVVVVGGGATGCEVAANIAELLRRAGAAAQLCLISGGGRLLESFPAGAAASVERVLRRRGVEVLHGARVESVEDGRAVLQGGGTRPFDHLVFATGLRPSALLRAAGLPTDEQGAMLVDRHLRSIGDPRIHGGGDCIALRDRVLPKIGVFAIRQAPILFHNLLAALEDRPRRDFAPQRRWLLILNLGDGTGLLLWDRFWWRGRAAFRLKDWIDRRFLAEYQD